MKLLTSIFLFVIIVSFSLKSSSQNLYNYNLFTQNSEIYNPSAILSDDIASFYLTTRMQWAGVEGFPKYNAMGGSYSISPKMRLGVSFFNSTHGVFNNLKAKVNYAYLAKISNNQSIIMGASLGVVNDRIFTSQLQYVDLTDELIQLENYNTTSITSAFGITYIVRNLEVQFIVPQILEHNKLNLYGIGILSYNIKSKRRDFNYKPSILIRNTELNKIQADAVFSIDWKKRLWVQTGVRSNRSFTFGIGNQTIAYAYETPVNSFSGSTIGSHEVLLKFRIKQEKSCPAYDNF